MLFQTQLLPSMLVLLPGFTGGAAISYGAVALPHYIDPDNDSGLVMTEEQATWFGELSTSHSLFIFCLILSQLEFTDANGGESAQWIPDGPLRPQAHLGHQLHHCHSRLGNPLLCSELPTSPPWLPPQWLFSGLRPAHGWSLHLRDCNCSLAWISCFHLCPHTKHGVNCLQLDSDK